MITIEFEISKNGYTLKDAIVLPDDHTMNDYLIDAIKQQRFDDWYAIVTAPQPEYQYDEEGNLVLDEDGNPIEVEVEEPTNEGNE